jgi:plastocyanin
MPETLTVPVGTTVTWTNKDAASHVVKFPDQSQTLGTGESFSRSFNTPGTFYYVCGIHASMAGKVIVQ